MHVTNKNASYLLLVSVRDRPPRLKGRAEEFGEPWVGCLTACLRRSLAEDPYPGRAPDAQVSRRGLGEVPDRAAGIRAAVDHGDRREVTAVIDRDLRSAGQAPMGDAAGRAAKDLSAGGPLAEEARSVPGGGLGGRLGGLRFELGVIGSTMPAPPVASATPPVSSAAAPVASAREVAPASKIMTRPSTIAQAATRSGRESNGFLSFLRLRG